LCVFSLFPILFNFSIHFTQKPISFIKQFLHKNFRTFWSYFTNLTIPSNTTWELILSYKLIFKGSQFKPPSLWLFYPLQGWDSDVLAILWATLFACFLTYDTTKLGLLSSKLLHWVTRSPNSLMGVVVMERASNKILESVSNTTSHIPCEIATLIASRRPNDPTSKIVADE